MAAIITGSIATDHLMTFPGRFADSLVADKLDTRVDTLIEDDRWEAADLPALAEAAAAAVLAHLGLGAHEIALLGCDDARIAALNADFRGKARPTNVLSWPAVELRRPSW